MPRAPYMRLEGGTVIHPSRSRLVIESLVYGTVLTAVGVGVALVPFAFVLFLFGVLLAFARP